MLNFKTLSKHINEPYPTHTYLRLIAGDASDRKFYRLENYSSDAILCMHFSTWEGGFGGDASNWIEMQKALFEMGLPVPKIIRVEKENNCIWIEDLGDKFLNHHLENQILDWDNPTHQKDLLSYKNCLNLLIKAQYPDKSVEHPGKTRYFDIEKLSFELNFFITHFLNNMLHMNLDYSHKLWHSLSSEIQKLCLYLANCEAVFCHRDYHARNIILYQPQHDELEKPFWIDFQDARMGPHTYDVVSLLRDSYTKLTQKTREKLSKHYFEELNKKRAELNISYIDFANFQKEYLYCGLQRNLKAIGSFAYLFKEKNKIQYMDYVPYTLDIINETSHKIYNDVDLTKNFPILFSILEKIRSLDFQEIIKRHTNI